MSIGIYTVCELP